VTDWFRSNSLSFVQFRPKNSYEINLKITTENNLIKETKNTKFLELDISCRQFLLMERPY
jgi:hypothetical protein